MPNESKVQEAIAILNSTAAFNTLVWRPQERRVSLRCATCFYNEIRGWMTGIFCSGVAGDIAEAEGRAESLQKMIGGKVHSSAHPINGFRQQPDDMLNVLSLFRTGKDDVSPFYGDEKMLRVLGAFENQILVTGDQSGVTMEFPFPTRSRLQFFFCCLLMFHIRHMEAA